MSEKITYINKIIKNTDIKMNNLVDGILAVILLLEGELEYIKQNINSESREYINAKIDSYKNVLDLIEECTGYGIEDIKIDD